MPDLSLSYPYSAVNGKSAMLRARLMATVTWRWCFAQLPEIRRGRILPRCSTLSTQNVQTFLRGLLPLSRLINLFPSNQNGISSSGMDGPKELFACGACCCGAAFC